MTSIPKFALCTIQPLGEATYCTNGVSVSVGSVVRVPGLGGLGWRKATVISTTDEQPESATESIIDLFVEPAPLGDA